MASCMKSCMKSLNTKCHHQLVIHLQNRLGTQQAGQWKCNQKVHRVLWLQRTCGSVDYRKQTQTELGLACTALQIKKINKNKISYPALTTSVHQRKAKLWRFWCKLKTNSPHQSAISRFWPLEKNSLFICGMFYGEVVEFHTLVFPTDTNKISYLPFQSHLTLSIPVVRTKHNPTLNLMMQMS